MKTPGPDLIQSWPRPSAPRPIVVIGAGAIVRTAHLPVYRRLGFPVVGIVDIDSEHARATAREFGIATVYPSLADAVRQASPVIFDLAVPGDQIVGILEQLPRGSAVLMQKPMGQDLGAATRILACCLERELVAAVNFQLRFSPGMLALHDLLSRHALGPIVDIDVRLVIEQPWHLWTFLEGAPWVEVPYHSIHYLDAIRWIAGEPAGVYCKSVGHPSLPKLRDARSSILLDYGDRLRCSLAMNHTHRAGPRHRASQLVVEGLEGAVRLTWGREPGLPRRARRHHGDHDQPGMARGPAAGLLVHRSVRRTDVEPAAVRGRRRHDAGRGRRRRDQDHGGRRSLLRVQRSRRHADPRVLTRE